MWQPVASYKTDLLGLLYIYLTDKTIGNIKFSFGWKLWKIVLLELITSCCRCT
jgi:hypothetical protein